MKYLLAVMILILWTYFSLSVSWNPKAKLSTNLVVGLGTIILVGLVYWVPFWLIFMK